MLIHIRHADEGEFLPDSLLFAFEEYSLKQKIDSFTKRIGAKQEDKSGENIPDPINIPAGSHVFARLAPETGDHFFFLLKSIKISCVHIVISSLSSLERGRGVPMDINSLPAGENISINYTDLVLGGIRLLYISPESLMQRSFRDDLNLITDGRHVGSVIIDNAHCISEWSVDFKPSYLRIPRLLEDIESINPKLTVIGFTSAREKMIAKDLENILGLKEITCKNNKIFCQNRISFQNIAVYGQDEKIRAYKNLKTKIPDILKNEGIFDSPSIIFPIYKDPYKQMEKGELRGPESIYVDEARQDVAITTQKENISESAKILISTSLGGMAKDRFLRGLRAGARDNRVISVWLADIPGKECESDMARRLTKVPLCKKNRCPFGRKNLCDYGKQHRLIRSLIPDITESMKDILRTGDELAGALKRGSGALSIPFCAENHTRKELALYRLMSAGIIELFFIDLKAEKPEFKIYGFNLAPDDEIIKGHLINYLNKNNMLISYASSVSYGDEPFMQIDKIIESMDEKIKKTKDWALDASKSGDLKKYFEFGDFFRCLIKYMPVFCEYPSSVIRKKLCIRAWNNKEFIKSKNCTYSDFINLVHVAEDDWQCGFCGACVPKMDFNDKMASPPLPGPKLSELESFFTDWVERDDIPFDFLTAEEKIKYFDQYINCMIIRCKAILEHSPENIKALYILNELSSGNHKEIYSKELVKVISRVLSPLKVIRLCETLQVSGEMKKIIFDILDDESKVMNSFEGEKWLFKEAVRLNEKEEKTVLLAGRAMLNQLAKFDFKANNLKLNRLSKEL